MGRVREMLVWGEVSGGEDVEVGRGRIGGMAGVRVV
jgi:hypothetical protein